MRVLGVLPSPNDVYVCVVDNLAQVTSMKKVALPANEDESIQLNRMLGLMETLILEAGVDRVAVVKAGRSKFGSSPMRHKIECVVQLAGINRAKPVAITAPQSLRAFEKNEPQNTLVCDTAYRPVGCRDAALAAWIELKKHA